MRNILRAPLTWLVVAEFAVVASLIVLAWNAVAHAASPAAVAQALVPAGGPTDASSPPLPLVPEVSRPAGGPSPGLNVDGGFWHARLVELNQELVYFEQLVWRIVHSGLLAAERYIEDVVVPSLKRAESAKG